MVVSAVSGRRALATAQSNTILVGLSIHGVAPLCMPICFELNTHHVDVCDDGFSRLESAISMVC